MNDIFPEDERLANLRRQREIHTCCRAAARRTTDNAAGLQFAMTRLRANGFEVILDDEIVNLIQRYREASGDFFREDQLEFDRFVIEQDIQRRESELALDATYGPLRQASPISTNGVDPGHLLRLLYPDGQRGLLFPTYKSKNPRIWHAGLAEDAVVQEPWYWPLPVNYAADADENTLIKCPEAVASWNSASTILNRAQVGALEPAINAGLVRARSIVSIPDGRACVNFAVDALNKTDWNSKCRDIKKRLGDMGVEVPNFRYDWLAHMPGGENNLVYLAP